MTTIVIEIGDTVKTRKSIKDGEAVLLPKGSIGKVCDCLGETSEGQKFEIGFKGLPFGFNFWADELQLVKKGEPRDRKKPRPEPTRHRQRAIDLGGATAEVDIKLAPLIRGLYDAGILTCMSCQEIEPGITWLMFPRIKYALVFVHKVSKVLESFNWLKDSILIDPDDDFGAVSIRFPLADLPKLKRLFPAG